ncbi:MULTISPECIES: hypothetical protein [Paenibacillus]|jgi:hypothetical protein|uniref:Uncharacterized protein n=2 Tax=Paenibacillus illinoisensis TaxID=59845 RepID=A0A2W0CK01_9BACL|nr:MULTISPECIES: hypothetical protein [Paenibacillus]MBM6382438.1 hypothetical protein [Paenibacillus sp.]MCM3205394.1 hypothetical protein [Paenibacillus illinoisensis]PAD31537.1 hypothetical protein CHH60_09405 [Paenibacillus sp. 7523-1]PYY28148.1 hypothetical protein PIL02S_03289 [Paenibacillus illinoisensis]WJH30288.1 hypothetical protein N6H13_06305 [Paenibacillus sp. CC-CFT742]
MVKLSLFAITKTIECLPPRIVDHLYMYVYKETTSTSKETWLFELIKELLIQNFGFDTPHLEDHVEIRDKNYRKRQQSKKYWLKKFKEELDSVPNNPVLIEISSWKLALEQMKASNAGLDIVAESERLIGVKDLNDLPALRLQQISEWATTSSTYLTDYRYLSSKKTNQIKKAIETDLHFIVADIIDKHDLTNAVDVQPHGLIEDVVFAEKSTNLKIRMELDEITNKQTYFDDYEISDNEFLRTIIKVEDGDFLLADKSLTKSLDGTDRDIIFYVLSQKDESFYTDRTITVDISKLVSKAYNSSGVKNYVEIEKRLRKIRSFGFQAVIKKKSEKARSGSADWSIFDSVVINSNPNGRRYAEIVIGTYFHQQYINQQTVKIYRDSLNSIEGNISKILVHALQKERLERYVQGNQFIDIFPLSYFLRKVRMDKRKTEQNMKKIQDALEEFKSLNFLIADYKRLHSSFEISFIPLTHTEMHDFFDQAEPPIQLTFPIQTELIGE